MPFSETDRFPGDDRFPGEVRYPASYAGIVVQKWNVIYSWTGHFYRGLFYKPG